MSPTDLETAARNRYNSISDNFFSQAEIFSLIYDAEMELARETLVIESTTTTPTVIGTQGYAYPTEVIDLKRVTYDGKKLKPLTFREDDAITGLNQTTLSQGTPQYYFIWDQYIYLRPIPSAVATLAIYSYNEPGLVTSTSTLEVPTMHHMALLDYVVSEMAAKDSNFNAANYYTAKWERKKQDIKRWVKKNRRGDSFNVVQDEDSLIEGYLGVV